MYEMAERQVKKQGNKSLSFGDKPKYGESKSTIQRKILNTHTGKAIMDVSEFLRVANISIDGSDKKRGILAKQLVSSESIYTVEEAKHKLVGTPFILGAPSTDPQGKDQYFKITELGALRLPTKIKGHEQPGIGKSDITNPQEIAGAQVRKNLNYADIQKTKIDLNENTTYLFANVLNKSNFDTCIVGTEEAGLGHPTLALNLRNTSDNEGVSGKARIGGELRRRKNIVEIDNRSGRYGGNRVEANLRVVKEIFQKVYPEYTFRTNFVDKRK